MIKKAYWRKNIVHTARWGTVILCMCAVLMTGCAQNDKAVVLPWQEDTEESAQSGITADLPIQETHETVTMIYVHVCGAVSEPGVVELAEGSRVEDALLAAGGFREDAAKAYVNLAARLEDGQQLYFPTAEEAESPAMAEAALQKEQQDVQSGKVNINTADEELLCTLPGIGESRARDIIAYREMNGSFQSIEDIMQVSGIKQSSFERLRDKITVN